MDSSLSEGHVDFSFNIKQFAVYLIKELVSILLAPLLAFSISAIVELMKNPSAFDIGFVYNNCIHNDVLLSILSVYLILYWEYIFSNGYDIDRYLFRLKWLADLLKGIGFVFCFILIFEATFFRYSDGVGPSVIVKVFDVFEGAGFIICLILQCISHPKNYITSS